MVSQALPASTCLQRLPCGTTFAGETHAHTCTCTCRSSLLQPLLHYSTSIHIYKFQNTIYISVHGCSVPSVYSYIISHQVIEPGHSAVASHVAIWPGISWSVVLPMVDPENGYGINKLTGKHIDDDIILRRPSRHGFTAEQPHNTSMFYLMWMFGLVSRSTLRAGPPANHHGPPTTDEPIAPP